ncbi:MAG TPA: indole-3-glycerol-phosphate synthase [Limnochordia bacterium]
MTLGRLEEILRDTRRRVEGLRSQRAVLERRALAAPPPPAFARAVAPAAAVGVIAEVKRRSPSAGSIRGDLDPVTHATAYVEGEAVAISVLTDEVHFGGSLADLAAVAAAVSVPVLRKDFVLDELQLFEARAAGASAVLLIVRALPGPVLQRLARAASGLGLGTLIEVHTERELEAAVAAEPTAVGVNSRDLGTFTVDRGVAEAVLRLVPRRIPAIAESGIETRADVARYAAAGADLVLVGTAVARATDPAAAVHGLTGVARVPGVRPA